MAGVFLNLAADRRVAHPLHPLLAALLPSLLGQLLVRGLGSVVPSFARPRSKAVWLNEGAGG